MFLCFKDLTNIDLFLTSREVEESLLRRETAPCLAWCYDNKSKLRKNKVLILLPLQIWEIWIVKRSSELLVGQVLLILFIFFNTWRLYSCKIKVACSKQMYWPFSIACILIQILVLGHELWKTIGSVISKFLWCHAKPSGSLNGQTNIYN